MTVYARSDLVAVCVSKDHGGCNAGRHTRPVENGVPAKVWQLDCPECEQFLRFDPLWATTISKIPETYDEVANREENEKRGARDRDQISAVALAKIAENLDLLKSLPTLRNNAAQPESPVLCPDGHESPAGAKFCVECGQPALSLAPVLCPEGHASPAGAKFCVECGARVGGAGDLAEALDALTSDLEWHDKVVVLPPGTKAQPEPPAPAAESAPEPPFGTESEPERSDPPAPVSEPPSDSWPSNTAMRGMKREELAAVAAEQGVDATGNRAQLLGRLIATANVRRSS